jgi:hypothetical protein
LSMAMLAASMFLAPFSRWLAIAVAIYAVMGTARGLAGIAITSSIMERVPSNFMGRVQNTFYFVGTGLQVVLALTVGAVAHRVSLAAGFAIIGVVYALAFISASWPLGAAPREVSTTAASD